MPWLSIPYLSTCSAFFELFTDGSWHRWHAPLMYFSHSPAFQIPTTLNTSARICQLLIQMTFVIIWLLSGWIWGADFYQISRFFFLYSRQQANIKSSVYESIYSLCCKMLIFSNTFTCRRALFHWLTSTTPKAQIVKITPWSLQSMRVTYILWRAKVKAQTFFHSHLQSPADTCGFWKPFQHGIVISRKLVFHLLFD